MIFCGRVGVLIIIKTTATRTQAGAINSETNGNEMELNSSVAMSAIKRWNPLPVVCGWFIIRIMGADYCATTNSPRNNSNSNQNTEQFRPDCLCVCCCGGASGAVAFFSSLSLINFLFDILIGAGLSQLTTSAVLTVKSWPPPPSARNPEYFRPGFFLLFFPHTVVDCVRLIEFIAISCHQFECLNVWMFECWESRKNLGHAGKWRISRNCFQWRGPIPRIGRSGPPLGPIPGSQGGKKRRVGKSSADWLWRRVTSPGPRTLLIGSYS